MHVKIKMLKIKKFPAQNPPETRHQMSRGAVADCDSSHKSIQVKHLSEKALAVLILPPPTGKTAQNLKKTLYSYFWTLYYGILCQMGLWVCVPGDWQGKFEFLENAGDIT